MSNTTLNFYDQLAENYHLIGKDWQKSVRWQGEVLGSVIQRLMPRNPEEVSLYDCSCGIGTQAIGLALQGYQVHATDLSPKSVEKAQANAIKMGALMTTGVADFRSLRSEVQGDFDVVISCDNSLPHLLTEEDLHLAIDQISQMLKSGGFFMGSFRDYDQIKLERPSGMPPRKFKDENGEWIYFQTWDWSQDGSSYDLELFILQKHTAQWDAPLSYKTRYRAWQRAEMDTALKKGGLIDIEWLLNQENRYYQPLVIAKKASL
jgi:SAM-dependent methyltransferase